MQYFSNSNQIESIKYELKIHAMLTPFQTYRILSFFMHFKISNQLLIIITYIVPTYQHFFYQHSDRRKKISFPLRHVIIELKINLKSDQLITHFNYQSILERINILKKPMD